MKLGQEAAQVGQYAYNTPAEIHTHTHITHIAFGITATIVMDMKSHGKLNMYFTPAAPLPFPSLSSLPAIHFKIETVAW